MKFLLLRPGDRRKKNKFFIFSPLTHPPLGLLYLGAVLEHAGHEVEVLDFHAEDISKEQLKDSLIPSDAVGMSVYTPDLRFAVDVSRTIKEIDPEIPLIIGGPHCIFYQRNSLISNPYADICVVGEGEQPILDIAQYLQGTKNLSNIHGIYYRKNNSIKSGKSLQIIDDLDELPFPARHLVDKYDYGDFPFGYKLKKRVTALITSKGCPFSCRFCTRYNNIVKNWGYRNRSAENVVREIQEIDKNYRSVWIVDDNFLADNKRAHKIFDGLIQIGTDVELYIEGARIDSADQALYKKMKKAGVKFIAYGIESGNQEVLDFYNKNITVQQIRETIKLAREMNFLILAVFILGAPIETKEHIDNTIKFACSLPIDFAIFAPLCYLRGSPLWVEAVKSKKISSDKYLTLATLRNNLGNFTEEELIQFIHNAYNIFYFRPTYLFRQLYRSILRNDYSLIINGLKFFPMIYNIGKS